MHLPFACISTHSLVQRLKNKVLERRIHTKAIVERIQMWECDKWEAAQASEVFSENQIIK